MLPVLPVLPEKPKFGEPCTGCGLCCAAEVCEIGRMVHGDNAPTPCPSLVQQGGKLQCELMIFEAAIGGPHLIAAALGVGTGCSMED